MSLQSRGLEKGPQEHLRPVYIGDQGLYAGGALAHDFPRSHAVYYGFDIADDEHLSPVQPFVVHARNVAHLRANRIDHWSFYKEHSHSKPPFCGSLICSPPRSAYTGAKSSQVHTFAYVVSHATLVKHRFTQPIFCPQPRQKQFDPPISQRPWVAGPIQSARRGRLIARRLYVKARGQASVSLPFNHSISPAAPCRTIRRRTRDLGAGSTSPRGGHADSFPSQQNRDKQQHRADRAPRPQEAGAAEIGLNDFEHVFPAYFGGVPCVQTRKRLSRLRWKSGATVCPWVQRIAPQFMSVRRAAFGRQKLRSVGRRLPAFSPAWRNTG